MAVKNIYLIRHAQSEANAGQAVRPNHEINVTEFGQGQAQQLADWLNAHVTEPISEIFVSQYVRTHQTAQPFLKAVTRTPTVMDDLHEFNFLDFDTIKDLSFDEIRVVVEGFWTKPPAHQEGELAESFEQFVHRVKKARAYFDRLPDGTYLVFTHGMWIGMLLWQMLLGDSPRLYNPKKFREFELSIRPKNCEVFLLSQLGMQKVFVRNDGQDDEIR